MAIRAEVSERNKYWLSKHRMYELRHFCKQYPEWVKALAEINALASRPIRQVPVSGKGKRPDPTARWAEEREFYLNRIAILKQAAEEADAVLGEYVLKGVTEDLSYEAVKSRYGVPCCKEIYYDRYRRFFWYLSRLRQ